MCEAHRKVSTSLPFFCMALGNISLIPPLELIHEREIPELRQKMARVDDGQ